MGDAEGASNPPPSLCLHQASDWGLAYSFRGPWHHGREHGGKQAGMATKQWLRDFMWRQKPQSRERHSRNKTSKSTTSHIPPLTRPHLLVLHKQFHQLGGTRHSNIGACGGHSHSNTIILRKIRSRLEHNILGTQRFDNIQLSFSMTMYLFPSHYPIFDFWFKMYNFLTLTCLKSVSFSSCHQPGLHVTW